MTVRAFALNAKTRAILTEIPFFTLSLNHKLNEAGSWSMELPVSFTSPNGTEILTRENFDVNFSAVVFVRDSNPLMYGLIEDEDGQIDEDDESLTMSGPDFSLGYMKRKLYLGTSFLTGIDQFSIAQTIINQAMIFGTTITALYEPSIVSGVIRTRNYLASDRKYTFELLQELSAVENGFDFCSGVIGTQSTGYTPTITMGYPQLYRRTGFTLATGKNISKISYRKSGTKYANLVQVGGLVKTNELSSPTVVQDAGDLATYLSFHKTASYPTVVDPLVLLDHANRDLRVYGNPQGAVEYTFTVDTSDPDCQVGSFRVGDEFVVRVKKGRISLDTLMRVREWSLKVDEGGSETLVMSMVQTGFLT